MEKPKIKKVDLTSDIGLTLYVIELPDEDLESWYITHVSENPYFSHPAWVPLKEKVVYAKKGYPGWHMKVLVLDEYWRPILLSRIEDINPRDPMHPLGISFKELLQKTKGVGLEQS
jgi:hypothetical protein